MKKGTIIKATVVILVFIYGIFIYPFPERFPVLSGRFVSFLVTMTGLSTLFNFNRKNEKNKRK